MSNKIFRLLGLLLVGCGIFVFVSKVSADDFQLDGMTDEHIKQILQLAYSVESTDLCHTALAEDISDEAVEEFKQYYIAFKRERVNSYATYFKNNTGWVRRADGITLSCHFYPSAMFIGSSNPNAKAANFSNAFRALKNRHGSSPNWKNTASMEAQFLCHAFTIGSAKNPWNIEPWRTESDLATVIRKGCNP